MRIGQKNKWAYVVVAPDCKCGEASTVSKSQDGITKHTCLGCFVKKEPTIEELLKAAGIYG